MQRLSRVSSATMALYISIWIGLIVVAYAMGIQSVVGQITGICCGPNSLFANPVQGAFNIVTTSLQNPLFIGILVVTGLSVGIIAGGNFGVLFVVPFALIMGIVNYFLLPTGILFQSGIPVEVQAAYVSFIAGLTILTVLEFMSGRQ